MTEQQLIVQRIIRLFGTQEELARLLRLNQSTISLWLKNGRIPSHRQERIIVVSQELVDEGKLKHALVPDDFFYLPGDDRYKGAGETIEVRVDSNAA